MIYQRIKRVLFCKQLIKLTTYTTDKTESNTERKCLKEWRDEQLAANLYNETTPLHFKRKYEKEIQMS